VLDTVRAFRADDLAAAGALFATSHVSMRDDYEVSVAEVDALVRAASDDEDVFGARLTGGGFGGAIVALTRDGCESDAARRIVRRYHVTTGRAGTILLPQDSRT
jgi:galactokinase